MKASLISVLSLTAVFLSSTAAAAVSKDAVINSVDTEKRTVTLDNTTYLVDEKTKIVIHGKPATIEDLEAEQTVKYKVLSAAEPKSKKTVASRELKAQIVAVDTEAGKIEVKPNSQDELISFTIGDATKVSGLGAEFDDLAVGQKVTLKFRSK